MAERQSPSRRTGNKTQSASRRPGRETTSSSQRARTERETPSQRIDVIRCENCGEDYSITYKRCPFCDERPGRTDITGRRVAAGGSYGRQVHPIQLVGLVISLVLIIAALFIVFTKISPLFFGDKKPGNSSSSASTSQSGSGAASSSRLPSASGSGDVSQPVTPVITITGLTLSKVDFTLQANEESQIMATVTPADSGATVAWTSSHPDAITVDSDGIVKNINTSGQLVKTTITATVGDKSAECTVYCRSGGSSSGGTTGGLTGGSTGGTVAANTPATIINAGGGLNIRSGPGTSYDVLASAKNGAQITVLEDDGSGWYKIDYGAGKTGYVSKDFVSIGG